MKFSEITEMIEKDSVIDNANLDRESLRVSLLHGKWYTIFMEEARLLRRMYNEFKKLKKFKTEYYLGKCTDDVYEKFPLHLKVLRSDLEIYLDGDEEMLALDEKVEDQRLKVNTIENFIKALNNRGYNIKTAVDFLKFKNGLN